MESPDAAESESIIAMSPTIFKIGKRGRRLKSVPVVLNIDQIIERCPGRIELVAGKRLRPIGKDRSEKGGGCRRFG